MRPPEVSDIVPCLEKEGWFDFQLLEGEDREVGPTAIVENL